MTTYRVHHNEEAKSQLARDLFPISEDRILHEYENFPTAARLRLPSSVRWSCTLCQNPSDGVLMEISSDTARTDGTDELDRLIADVNDWFARDGVCLVASRT